MQQNVLLRIKIETIILCFHLRLHIHRHTPTDWKFPDLKTNLILWVTLSILKDIILGSEELWYEILIYWFTVSCSPNAVLALKWCDNGQKHRTVQGSPDLRCFQDSVRQIHRQLICGHKHFVQCMCTVSVVKAKLRVGYYGIKVSVLSTQGGFNTGDLY